MVLYDINFQTNLSNCYSYLFINLLIISLYTKHEIPKQKVLRIVIPPSSQEEQDSAAAIKTSG